VPAHTATHQRAREGKQNKRGRKGGGGGRSERSRTEINEIRTILYLFHKLFPIIITLKKVISNLSSRHNRFGRKKRQFDFSFFHFLSNMDHSDTLRMMVAGGMAGSIAKTITAPLSRLTILYQIQAVTATRGQFKSYAMNQSLSNVVRDITRQEGLRSFWRGNLTAVVHRFPHSGVNFTVYDLVKKQLRKGIHLSTVF
jgi:hypothetical protein